LFAGHENTASALSWALYWIHQLPEVHEKVCREIEQLGERATSVEIAQLPYLSAVCEEVLRIYPGVLTVTRILKSPFSVMGHRFDAGTALIPCVYLAHRREDLYPEPARFLPERFLERQYSQYEYLPFGAGPRRCLGRAFAQFEMKLVLATILSRWQLALPDRRPVKPVRREALTGPPRGLELVAVCRR
jgi:cytochrome P450